MKYRIIGDQHGRKNWRQLVEPFDENTMYVFVGDYTDPYYGWELVTHEQMIEEIKAIFKFAEEHPDNVILLYGNHDLQYILGRAGTNRYDYEHANEISLLMIENENLCHGVAYQVCEKYLITHAGVTMDWYTHRCEYDKDNLGKESLEEICRHINDVWFSNKELFTFRANATRFSDGYGDDTNHSPLWVRPTSLWQGNLFGFGSDKIQVVGHTPFDDYFAKDRKETVNRIGTFGTLKTPATEKEIDSGGYLLVGTDKCGLVCNDFEHVDIIDVDCLRRETACIDIDGETLEWKKFSVGEDLMKAEDIL